MTGVRLTEGCGVDARPGDGPATDPGAYAFGTEFHALEWNAMYSAVAEHLGRCERSGVAGAKAGGVRLGGPRRMSRRAVLRHGALRVRVRATGSPARVKLVARAKGRRIAARRLTLRPGRARWVRAPLTRAGRRLLRRHRRLAVRLVAGGSSRRVVLR
jgi:hypothetical protein